MKNGMIQIDDLESRARTLGGMLNQNLMPDFVIAEFDNSIANDKMCEYLNDYGISWSESFHPLHVYDIIIKIAANNSAITLEVDDNDQPRNVDDAMEDLIDEVVDNLNDGIPVTMLRELIEARIDNAKRMQEDSKHPRMVAFQYIEEQIYRFAASKFDAHVEFQKKHLCELRPEIAEMKALVQVIREWQNTEYNRSIAKEAMTMIRADMGLEAKLALTYSDSGNMIQLTVPIQNITQYTQLMHRLNDYENGL